MSFVRKYGVFAIFLLLIYGLFILGGVLGFKSITGDAISLYEYNKPWIVYGVIGVLGIILVFIVIWLAIYFIRKGKKKKKKKLKTNGNEIKIIGKKSEKIEKEIGRKIGKVNRKKVSEKSGEKKSWFGFLKKNKNKKINELLLNGGRALSKQDIKTSEEIYDKVKKLYDPKDDGDKELYKRILNYYKNILKDKKK